jgi:hypothetical protein
VKYDEAKSSQSSALMQLVWRVYEDAVADLPAGISLDDAQGSPQPPAAAALPVHLTKKCAVLSNMTANPTDLAIGEDSDRLYVATGEH